MKFTTLVAAHGRLPLTDPTAALIDLATKVMSAAKSSDMDYDLSEVLGSLTLTCQGPGRFHIRIDSPVEIEQLRLLTAIDSIQEPTDE